jgi:predicted secreted Zn-dependent protease
LRAFRNTVNFLADSGAGNSLMNRAGPAAAVMAASLILLHGIAIAKPLTNYVHYLIVGSSAEGLYRSMISNGPLVGGGKAYASTRMDPKVSATTVATRHSCRVDTFQLEMTFTIKLPQLKDASAVDAASRKNFDRFYEFARKHEEGHRSIWLACAKEAEALAVEVKASTCSAAEAKALSIVDEVAKRCDAKHAEFDAAEKAKLFNHPFIKQVVVRQNAPVEPLKHTVQSARPVTD